MRRQEELRASEEKLRSLFALSPLGINLQDMEGRYTEVNDAFLKIVGYERDEILTLTCYDIIPQQYLEEEPERLRQLHETGLIPAYEKAYRRKDGSLVEVSTSTVLVSGPEGDAFKWTIVEDITERRQVQAAQKRLNEDLEGLSASARLSCRRPFKASCEQRSWPRLAALSPVSPMRSAHRSAMPASQHRPWSGQSRNSKASLPASFRARRLRAL
ncbi:MAG: PAS domain S-box protein [Rhodospirillaceae bacterium]|nr:PAS domain S-box protein [Rhodospirillaceae bacterium]